MPLHRLALGCDIDAGAAGDMAGGDRGAGGMLPVAGDAALGVRAEGEGDASDGGDAMSDLEAQLGRILDEEVVAEDDREGGPEPPAPPDAPAPEPVEVEVAPPPPLPPPLLGPDDQPEAAGDIILARPLAPLALPRGVLRANLTPWDLEAASIVASMPWAPFRFTYKPSIERVLPNGAIQAFCPCHRKNVKTGC